MPLFFAERPCSIADDQVVAVYKEDMPGRYCPTTLILNDGISVKDANPSTQFSRGGRHCRGGRQSSRFCSGPG
jgi:hypothetical protein